MQPVAGRFPETEWIGRRIAIGELELTVDGSLPPLRLHHHRAGGQLDEDPDILRTLVKNNAHNLGRVLCGDAGRGR